MVKKNIVYQKHTVAMQKTVSIATDEIFFSAIKISTIDLVGVGNIFILIIWLFVILAAKSRSWPTVRRRDFLKSLFVNQVIKKKALGFCDSVISSV